MKNKEKLKLLKEQVEILNRELRQVYSDGLKEYANDIFKKFPFIKGFSWTQYTPYFNDGEPCEFGINADYPDILIPFDDGENEWVDLNHIVHYSTGKVRDEYKDFIKKEEVEELDEAISEFASEVLYPFENQLQALLGEGRVVVTPDGVEVEEYNHD